MVFCAWLGWVALGLAEVRGKVGGLASDFGGEEVV